MRLFLVEFLDEGLSEYWKAPTENQLRNAIDAEYPHTNWYSVEIEEITDKAGSVFAGGVPLIRAANQELAETAYLGTP